MDLADKNNDYEDRYAKSLPNMDFSGEYDVFSLDVCGDVAL